jgi:tetratricopeptide (TPR) repeat protein/tRNA A-37 threonylcarbamoyl transferase component Bud32
MPSPARSADRNLLFGLLALQMDFLSRDQLLEAMNAWMLEKYVSLGEILCRRGVLADDDRTDIERLVEKYVKRHGGDAQASLAALRVEPAVCQELARLDDAEVRATIVSLRPIEAGGNTVITPAKEAAPESGVRFWHLRPHAKGGLGEVFVALDRDLHREVALKEIHPHLADHPDNRARFVLEAEVTGNLEHPGIVPVYALGVYPNGRPFYAMRFIRGRSMQEVIADFHKADAGPRRDAGERRLALRELLGRLVAVCHAIDYAHSRGVIHRDLKPANIMVGDYGETLVVDWGLARLRQPKEGQADLERPVMPATGRDIVATTFGQVVGTLAYMPPEQAQGRLDRVGVASDVFALGATLYHLLTAGPPYQGDDLLGQARRCEPALARQRNRTMPAALAAVCVRAMAKKPEDRYPTARAFAEEIERWLADEPVQAYREPLPARLHRWGRRHRTLVSVAAALLLATVAALGAGLWFVNAEKDRTARERDRAIGAEVLAQKRLKLAKEVIDDCFNVARNDPLFQGPRMEQARKLLLHKALRFHKNFLLRQPDDRDLYAEARQWHRIADLESVLGVIEEAREAEERARELCRALVRAHPDVPDYRDELADVHRGLGAALGKLARYEEALEEYREARDLKKNLIQAGLEPMRQQKELVSLYNHRAALLGKLGKHKEALQEFQQAHELCLMLLRQRPDVLDLQSRLASVHFWRARFLRELRRPKEALKDFQQARELGKKVVKAFPDVSDYRAQLASTHTDLGYLLSDLGKLDEALAEFHLAAEMQKKLVEDNPDLPEYREQLAWTYNTWGQTLWELTRDHTPQWPYRQARELFEKLVQAHPNLPGYQRGLAFAHANLGYVRSACGEREALKEYQRAVELQQKLVKEYPQVADYQRGLAWTHNSLGERLSEMGNYDEAQEQYRQARELFEKLVQAHPNLPGALRGLVFAHANLGNLLSARGKWEEALKEHQRADELQEKLVKAHPDVPEDRDELAFTHRSLVWSHIYRGQALSALNRRDEAQKAYRQARELSEKLMRARPNRPEYQEDLASSHVAMGSLLSGQGKAEEALREYQRAVELQQKLVKAYPRVEQYQGDLAWTHHNRGWTLAGLAKREEALQAYQQAQELFEKLVLRHYNLPWYQSCLALNHCKRASLLFALGRTKEELEEYQRAAKLQERLVRAYPNVPQYQNDLGLTLATLGFVLATRGKREEGLKECERARVLQQKLVERYPDHPGYRRDLAGAHYNLARVYAFYTRNPDRDSTRPLPHLEKQIEQDARQALAELKRAAADGHFRDPTTIERLEHDGDFALVRDRDDYRAFRKSLPMKP